MPAGGLSVYEFVLAVPEPRCQLQLLFNPPSSKPSTTANTERLRETMFEPERMGFSSAGEFVSRSGLARSAGNPRVNLARAQRPGSPFFW